MRYRELVEAPMQPKFSIGQKVQSRPSYSAFHDGMHAVSGVINDIFDRDGEIAYGVEVDGEMVNDRPYQPQEWESQGGQWFYERDLLPK